MSRYLNVYIERFNNVAGEYQLVKLGYWDEERDHYEPVMFWPWNGTHELFEILDGSDMFDYTFNGLPSNASEDMKNIYNEMWSDETYQPRVRWTTLADLELYAAAHPEIPDYDSDEPGAMKPNPIKDFIQRIDFYCEFADDVNWGQPDSRIRIIYWLD